VLNLTDLGIRVILWIGKIVPLPAPAWFAQSLQRVEVTCNAEGTSGFQLTVALSRDTVLDYTGLSDGTLDPYNRVIIGVVMGAVPEILFDGVILHHQFAPNDQTGKTTLTVSGKDVTAMMDLVELHVPYVQLPDAAIAALVMAKYAPYGIVPTVIPTANIPLLVETTPWQAGETDLKFLNRIAKRNGYIFFVEPLTLGVNTGYLGPDVRLGLPQSALTANMGAATNVISISFSHDPLEAVGVSGTLFLPLAGGIEVPLPPLSLPAIPPLAAEPSPAMRTLYLGDLATMNPAEALGTMLGAMMSGRDTVTCEGTLDAVRYGGVLRARRPVGVRGVGFSYDGFYWVKRVTHTIAVQEGKYTQAFSLGREGLGAILPEVVP